MTKSFNLENVVFENARKSHENYLLKFQEQDLQDAIENYVEVLTLNPEKAECYYRLASLMYETGQITLESTIEQCKKAMLINPKNINAYIYAGYYLEQAKDFDNAENTFKQAIKLSEFKSARARLILASTIKKRLEYQGFNLFSGLQYFYYLLTGGITLVADFSALKMFYKNISDNIVFHIYSFLGSLLEKLSVKNTFDFYDAAISKTQRREFFYDKIAKLYLKLDNVEMAIDSYKKAFSFNPNNKEILIKLTSLTQNYFPEKVDTLIDYYSNLLELEEQDLSSIYYELGHLYLQKNDIINAVSAFKLALENNEDNAYYNDALAYAYVQAELFDDAIEYYQRAIKLNPDRLWTVNVCHSLGLIYQKCKGNYEAAIASFQAGAILDNQNENILIALADVYAIQKDNDSAIKIYNDVLNLNPQNYEAYSKLGIVLWDNKQTVQAIDSYKKALSINPNHDLSYNNLGVILLDEINDIQTAIDCFEQAIILNPSYTLAYYNLGRAFESLGKFCNAASNYQMAFDLNKITNVLEDDTILSRLNNLFNT
jgi:tetratricopeptide (TPR) repeat protein